jgi:hypothetical protein
VVTRTVKMPSSISETVDFVEDLVFDRLLVTDKELMDLIEVALAGGAQGRFANTIAHFIQHPDKRGAWDRFVISSTRIFGPDWRATLKGIAPTKMSQPHMLACDGEGCMELAWGRDCDQCMARRWSRG